MQKQHIVKIIGNVSDWLSYTGGALIKVADSAGSTVLFSDDVKMFLIKPPSNLFLDGSKKTNHNDLAASRRLRAS